MQFPRLWLWASVALSALPCMARATYSIVAADTRTREVGGAGASCVYPSQVSVIFGVAPGFGAVHAQARANTAGRDRAAQLLAMGQAPADIIAAITAMNFDTSAPQRQYGVVDVMGRSAGYTGAQNSMFADDVQGTVQGFVYSVQGNILTGAEVLEQASSAFEAKGCDLPERLMLALEAGAANGEGDTRCTGPSRIAANSAFIQVDRPDMPSGSYLKLSTGTGRDVDPLPALRMAFDRWRSSHPCGGTDAGTRLDAGASGDAAAADAASPRDSAVVQDSAAALDATADARIDADPGRDAATTLADAASDATSAPALADATSGPTSDAGLIDQLPPDTTSEAHDDGCSARPGSETPGASALLLLALGLVLRRARAGRRA